MVPTSVYREFLRVGQDLFATGINNSHSGNMSILMEGSLAITRTQSKLHRLEPGDVIRTNLHFRDAASRQASTDLEIHRSVYQATGRGAVIHAHAPYAVTLSFDRDRIVPIDVEGQYYFDHIPIVDTGGEVGTPRLGKAIAAVLKTHKILVLRGHGTVAAGPTLDDCLHTTTMVDSMCRLIFLRQTDAATVAGMGTKGTTQTRR